jgi:hypothetical protein
VTGQRDRQDAVRIYLQYMAAAAQYGTQFATHAGDVSFTCEREGRPLQGYAYAQTFHHVTAGMPAALWNTGDMLLYGATPEQVGTAAAVSRHLHASFQVNPQWQAIRRQTRQVNIENEMKVRREISSIIAGVHERRSASEERIAQQRALAIRGLENVVDPAAGRALRVESSSGYCRVDPGGTIVGTQSRSQPAVDFRELCEFTEGCEGEGGCVVCCNRARKRQRGVRAIVASWLPRRTPRCVHCSSRRRSLRSARCTGVSRTSRWSRSRWTRKGRIS